MDTDSAPPRPHDDGSSFSQLLPGTWRCLVCQRPSNQIHVLPCQHKFCRGCLELWAGIYVNMYHGRDEEFPCQVCWKLYVVPEAGVEAFTQDYRVRKLEEELERMCMDTAEQPPAHEPNVTAQNLQPSLPIGTPSGLLTTTQTQINQTTAINHSPGGTAYPPSMISHMAAPPPPTSPNATTQSYSDIADPHQTANANYCMRSHHLYMHMT